MDTNDEVAEMDTKEEVPTLDEDFEISFSEREQSEEKLKYAPGDTSAMMAMWRKPFGTGWRREVVSRSTAKLKKAKDVYYFSPEGKKFRSKKEIEKYLQESAIDSSLSIDCFTFRGEPVFKEPFEIIRSCSEKKTEKEKKKEDTISSPSLSPLNLSKTQKNLWSADEEEPILKLKEENTSDSVWSSPIAASLPTPVPTAISAQPSLVATSVFPNISNIAEEQYLQQDPEIRETEVASLDSSLEQGDFDSATQSVESGRTPQNLTPTGRPKRKVNSKNEVSSTVKAMWRKPFEMGWRRDVAYRSKEYAEGKRAGDVYYFSPEGKKFRSAKAIEKHLLETMGDSSIPTECFTFRVEPVFEEPLETIRIGKPQTKRRAKNGIDVGSPEEGEKKIGGAKKKKQQSGSPSLIPLTLGKEVKEKKKLGSKGKKTTTQIAPKPKEDIMPDYGMKGYSMKENDTWLQELMGGVSALWKENQLCDVSLITKDGGTFQAHSVILCAASPVLKEMLLSGNRNIHFDGTSSEACKTLLSFIYTGVLASEPETTSELMSLARDLNLTQIIEIMDYQSKQYRTDTKPEKGTEYDSAVTNTDGSGAFLQEIVCKQEVVHPWSLNTSDERNLQADMIREENNLSRYMESKFTDVNNDQGIGQAKEFFSKFDDINFSENADVHNTERVEQHQEHCAAGSDSDDTVNYSEDFSDHVDDNSDNTKISPKNKKNQCKSNTGENKRVISNLPPYPPTPDSFLCIPCELKFTTKKDYLRHSRKNHGFSEKARVCRFCSTVCKNTTERTDHEDEFHATEKYQCETCGKVFQKSNSLKSHQRYAHVLKGQKHKRRVYNNAVCTHCGKALPGMRLKYHIERYHTEEKKYKCEECGKAFPTSASLKTHKKIHMDKESYPYKCSYCPFRGTRKHVVAYHERIHTGEKPYECDICKKRFRISLTLRSHMNNQHGVQVSGIEEHQKYFKPQEKPENVEVTFKKKNQETGKEIKKDKTTSESSNTEIPDHILDHDLQQNSNLALNLVNIQGPSDQHQYLDARNASVPRLETASFLPRQQHIQDSAMLSQSSSGQLLNQRCDGQLLDHFGTSTQHEQNPVAAQNLDMANPAGCL